MPLILSPPAMSRTRPMKLVTPPISVRPRVSAAISAPGSKSSRWTRIIASASGDRREECDLVARLHAMRVADIFAIDRDAHEFRIVQRLGVVGPTRLQPINELGDGRDRARRIDGLFRGSDSLPQRGEIEDFHRANVGRLWCG